MSKINLKIEKAFLELLRCGMWGTKPSLLAFSELSSADWSEIYSIAGRQTVLGICLKVVLELPSNLQPPSNLLLQWIGVNRFIEANNRQMLQVWHEFSSKLNAAGFETVVFKGMTVAKWYAHPLSRQSSDIDVFIPERFDEAIQLIKSWGFECEHKTQHDSIVYKGVTIEIHPRLMTTPFPPRIDCKVCRDTVANGMSVSIPDPDTNCLLLLSHAGGHFLFPGIGFRFLCDWAVFLKSNYQNINREIVQAEAKRMGLLPFLTEFTKLAECKLGLDFPDLELWTKGSIEKYCYRDRKSVV